MSSETQPKQATSKEEMLLAAAIAGRVDEVERLLDEGVDLEECEGGDGSSALHEAARAGKAEVVRLLLRRGADVHEWDAFWREPIHDAAYGGDVETLRVLVEAGASVTVTDEDNLTPAHYAAREGRVSMLEEIERLGGLQHVRSSDQRDTPLSAALRGLRDAKGAVDGPAPDWAGAARFLVAKGADPDEALLQFCELPGSTLRAQLELLLELGANPQCETEDGWRPVMLAARYGHREVIEFLLDDPRTTQDTLNMTLACLIIFRKDEVSGLLLERGADRRIPEIMKSLPDTYTWLDGAEKLRRHLNAHLIAGDIEAAMPSEGAEAAPARASKGFTL